jgi:hypothetical protein
MCFGIFCLYLRQKIIESDYEDKEHRAYGSSSNSNFDGLRQ